MGTQALLWRHVERSLEQGGARENEGQKTGHVVIVHPTGDILRFYVDSSRPGVDPYFVDLKAYWLNGFCNCPDFDYRCKPSLVKRRNLSQDVRDKLPPITCKHIEAAQRFAFRELLQRAMQGKQATETGE